MPAEAFGAVDMFAFEHAVPQLVIDEHFSLERIELIPISAVDQDFLPHRRIGALPVYPAIQVSKANRNLGTL